MKDTLKTVEEMLKSEVKKYETEHKDGMKMTDKDPERLAHITMALVFSEMLCLMEEVKEKGLSSILKGKGSEGKESGSQEQGIGFNKMSGGGGWNPMEMLYNIPGLSPMSPTDNYNNQGGQYHYEDDDMQMRRGVPGSGGNRGGRKRNSRGQYTRNSYDDNYSYNNGYDDMDDNLDDNYNSPQNAQSGNSGGRGNTGGRGGNTSPQNTTVTTGQPVGPMR